MGITEQGLEFLVTARSAGVSFERTITIGRQSLLVPADRLGDMLAAVGGPAGRPYSLPADHDGFAEPVLERLGARDPRSIDASGFEGATDMHDLNTPLPATLAACFSTVLDGGALEHIFDFPTAIRNTMEMVEAGGHLLSITPANNAAGHGFYQFSPELYFRILSPENGFTVERMLLAEVGPRATWYAVIDPAAHGRRVEFTTRRQAYLYIQARRLDAGPVLRHTPVQSDYATEWRRRQGTDAPQASTSATAARTSEHGRGPLPQRVRAVARRCAPLRASVVRARQTAARVRRLRQPFDPAAFRPLGRRLS